MHFKQFDCGFAMFEVDSDDEATDGWSARFSEMRKSETMEGEGEDEEVVVEEVEVEEERGETTQELHENDMWNEKQVNFMSMYRVFFLTGPP